MTRAMVGVHWDRHEQKNFLLPSRRDVLVMTKFIVTGKGGWGRSAACGLAAMQLGTLQGLVFVVGVYGTLLAEWDWQCARQRAELTAVLHVVPGANTLLRLPTDNLGAARGFPDVKIRRADCAHVGRRSAEVNF